MATGSGGGLLLGAQSLPRGPAVGDPRDRAPAVPAPAVPALARPGRLCLPPTGPSGAPERYLTPAKDEGEQGELGLTQHRTNKPPGHAEGQVHRLPGHINRERR